MDSMKSTSFTALYRDSTYGTGSGIYPMQRQVLGVSINSAVTDTERTIYLFIYFDKLFDPVVNGIDRIHQAFSGSNDNFAIK